MGNSGTPTSTRIGETGQGLPRQIGDATWDHAVYDATMWNAGGTPLPGGNVAAVESAASTFTSFDLGADYTWSSSRMVYDVQSWVDGRADNHGWLLKSDVETTPQSFLAFFRETVLQRITIHLSLLSC